MRLETSKIRLRLFFDCIYKNVIKRWIFIRFLFLYDRYDAIGVMNILMLLNTFTHFLLFCWTIFTLFFLYTY